MISISWVASNVECRKKTCPTDLHIDKMFSVKSQWFQRYRMRFVTFYFVIFRINTPLFVPILCIKSILYGRTFFKDHFLETSFTFDLFNELIGPQLRIVYSWKKSVEKCNKQKCCFLKDYINMSVSKPLKFIAIEQLILNSSVIFRTVALKNTYHQQSRNHYSQ